VASRPQRVTERFLRFTGAGAIGTVAHYLTLYTLVDFLGANAVAASSAGYLVGAVTNYLLNYYFTFRSDKPHSATAVKFFAVAIVGFFLNAGVMWLFTEMVRLHYLIAQLLATALILLWNFAANDRWTFGVAGSDRIVDK
jgi:putative flippase GtrA